TETEGLAFGRKSDGWVTHSILDYLEIDAKVTKGKYSEEEFDSYLDLINDKVISLVEYLKSHTL
ncbi:MAG: hypothetical protein ACRC4L_02405, partial [Mycoplasma sp.]